MNDEQIKKLKQAALDCHGWHWPDRKKVDGVHQFGRRDEDGNFSEIGTIDASTYTGEYADDLRVLKFLRAAQPATILKLIARIEELDTPFCVKCGGTEICSDGTRTSSAGSAVVTRYDMTTEYNKYACEDVVVENASPDGQWIKYSDVAAILSAAAAQPAQIMKSEDA